MSIIPNIRDKFVKPLFENTKVGKEMLENPEPNAYYQGNLDEESASYIAGYDHVVEEVLPNFFQNLIMYLDQFEECGFDDQRVSALNNHLTEFLALEKTDTPLDLDTISDSQIRLVLTIIRTFWSYAEMERNDIGTSFIESMSDEERAECQDKCKAGYKNFLSLIQEAKEKGQL